MALKARRTVLPGFTAPCRHSEDDFVIDATTYPRARTLAALRSASLAMVLFAAAIGLLFGALGASGWPTRAVVWGCFSLASYAAGLLCLVGMKKGLAHWKFGPWTLLWCIPTFGIATIGWSHPQVGPPTEILISSVLRALWLVAVGLTAWVIGYFTGFGRSARKLLAAGLTRLSQRYAPEVRSPAAPWILYAIGVGARLTSLVTTGRFGYVGDPVAAVSAATGYGKIVSLLGVCAPLAVCAAALQVYRERLPGAQVTFAILFVTELAFGAVAGGKENSVIAVLAVVIPLSVAHYRIPRIAAIAGVLFFLAIVVPFNQAYRNAAQGSSTSLTPGQEVAQAPEILNQTLTGHSPLTTLSDSVTYLLHRVQEIDSPAIILQRTGGQIAFISPVQLVEAPLIDIVPRAIWPGKPILTPGYQFSQQYYGLPRTVYTSSAITPVGDLYRHGGWIPVIAGMFLIGGGTRLLDDVLDVRNNPHAVFLILLLIPSIVLAEDDWATMLAGLPAIFLTWLFTVFLTFRARRST
jgi:hypothetical protein